MSFKFEIKGSCINVSDQASFHCDNCNNNWLDWHELTKAHDNVDFAFTWAWADRDDDYNTMLSKIIGAEESIEINKLHKEWREITAPPKTTVQAHEIVLRCPICGRLSVYAEMIKEIANG